ncbi:MAG: hypothetical protein GSR85_10590 [Desulfurococcales archaeon]|nr:hypothetical protein [Desulfurococcales archaeon]
MTADTERITDLGLISRMIIESFNSPIQGFIFDTSLVDEDKVKEILRSSGVSPLLLAVRKGNIIIYLIDLSKVEAHCRYNDCKEDGQQVTCLQECINRRTMEIARKIAKNIKEYVDEMLKS